MKKKWIVLIVVGSTVTSFAFSCAFFLFTKYVLNHEPFPQMDLPKKLVSYYSDDNNFNHFKGKIIDVDFDKKREELIQIASTTCLDDYDAYITDHPHYMMIHCHDLEQTLKDVDLSYNTEISFISSFAYDEKISIFPIVQLTINDEEILSYEEVKESLLEWASKKHWSLFSLPS